MNRTSKKIIVYAFLFFAIMIIDQRILTASNLLRSAFRQMTLAPFLFFVLLQLNRAKIKLLRYKIYVMVTIPLSVVGFVYLIRNQEFYLQYSVLLVEIFLFGFIVLYLISNYQDYINKVMLRNRNFLFWIMLLFLMGISKYDERWTFGFLVVIVLMYIFSPSIYEEKALLKGMIFGIIASYFFIQGLAFVFRPYDMIRYGGLYNNTNMNALFYVIVFSAFLSNQFRLYYEKKGKIKKLVNLVFMSSVFAFTILTMGKAALLTEIILLLSFMLIVLKNGNIQVKHLFKHAVIWLVTTAVLVPVCFSAARYIPPIFHHSVWFYGEYSESRVHSFDPYNSSKYPEVTEIANQILLRFLGIEPLFLDEPNDISETIETAGVNVNTVKITAGDGSDALHPLYVDGSASTSYSARIGIWKEYINRLNIFGHRTDEPHFWLTQKYYIFHAHNIFIEYAYNFGLINGILFLIGYAYILITQFVNSVKRKTWRDLTVFFFLAIVGIFGMAELDWYVGQAPLTLFFFMLCITFWEKKRELRGGVNSEFK